MNDQQVLGVIDRIYDAALDASLWPEVLSEIASAVGGPLATVLPLDKPSGLLSSPGLEEAVGVYSEYWWTIDTILEAVLRRKNHRGVLCDWRLLQIDAMSRDPFYQDFRKDFGLGHWVGANLELYPGEIYSFAVQLAADRAPLDQLQISHFEVLSRHLGRAMAITDRMPKGYARGEELSETLSHLYSGAAILDPDGDVVIMNSAMEAYAVDGLRVIRRRLKTGRSEDQEHLDDLVRRAGSVCVGDQGPSIILLSKPSGLRPFLVRAIPISNKKTSIVWSERFQRRQILILVVDMDRESIFQPLDALLLLGLTPAEAHVAALIGLGRSVKATADFLGSAEGTIRNQLKHIFCKLDIRKQSDLVRIVEMLSAFGGSRCDNLGSK